MLFRRNMEKKIQNFSLYIIGTTATGKTKLSLNIGERFKGQVVSADSMQMYRHADILTAKATKEEQSIVKHHMIDIFDLQVVNFNRNDYYYLAKQAFDKIHSENSFPIVIGGTNYYIETLLFKQKIAENRINLEDPNAFILEMQKKALTNFGNTDENYPLQKYQKNDNESNQQLKSKDNESQEDEDEEYENNLPPLYENDNIQKSKEVLDKEQEVRIQLQQMSNEEKYKQLKELDPLIANKLHPNDERRIQSYLMQALVTGIPPSNSMEDHENVPLRDKNCLIFWPRCKSKEKLDAQIRKRIYEMISENGIYEAFYIFETIIPQNVESEEDPIFLKGVLQSIGYKEFFPFYRLYLSRNYPHNLSKEEKTAQIKQLMYEDEEGKKVITQCIEKLVTHTIQYTKRQLKWIRHRIMMNSDSEEIKNRLFVFEFDEFTSENFKEKAINPANEIISKYFELAEKYNESNGDQHPIEQLANDEFLKQYLIKLDELMDVRKAHMKKGLKDWKNYYCDICKKEIHGELNWSIHNTSRKHKKAIKHIEKSAIRAKYQELKSKKEELNEKDGKEDKSKLSSDEDLNENNNLNDQTQENDKIQAEKDKHD
ncbi:tRNA delta(2)-isopentenylpyrophosphate transferase, putative (macronuclear) [Tetrahymena thermophila SB210]|uniref:tRNA dimethylallyltransferase n=1 Tax=Tetrahymena thermophila (strain SB210) TaxID=312017 RepID=Q23QL9_TETTS|nr:tRNA delta(2)-isopentenylpyrophosphate transferase, putative [Tetrahymena thermophila SB210]EAR98869.3 tRNA delta(2)-isopentenylpyrophosphate transferase, putative [Tetrahymena thermophila SB210]|eukprot:XP_001019114.3 tRNA delta(2)-isopentenylpyrophosphate transferase, putative [Tetrahymena thermophila SB210]